MNVHGIWPELLSDLGDPRVVWQLVAILVCVALGWGVAAIARRTLKERERRSASLVERGMRPFSGVLAPLVAVGLLLLAKPIVANWSSLSLVRMAIALLASFALIQVVFYVLRRVFARSGRVGKFLLLFEKLFALLVWLGLAAWITGLGPDVVSFFDNTLVPIGRHKVSLLTILQGAISVAITVLVALWFGATLEERLMRMDTVHSSLRAVMARTVRALLIVVAVLLSLSLVGIDLTVLSVFGGALGVGLGLGLQKIVGSYFSGFVILIERSLALGDMVKVGEFQGQVTRINTRYTVLRGLDGSETVVPNDMLVSQAVQNFSLTDRRVRAATQLSVGYETDLDTLLPLLVQAVGKVPRVLVDPPPHALLLRFGADGLDLEIGFWLADPENGRGGLVSEVNKAIWAVVKEQKVNIPYPQREIRFGEPLPTLAEGSKKMVDKAASFESQQQKTA